MRSSRLPYVKISTYHQRLIDQAVGKARQGAAKVADAVKKAVKKVIG